MCDLHAFLTIFIIYELDVCCGVLCHTALRYSTYLVAKLPCLLVFDFRLRLQKWRKKKKLFFTFEFVGKNEKNFFDFFWCARMVSSNWKSNNEYTPSVHQTYADEKTWISSKYTKHQFYNRHTTRIRLSPCFVHTMHLRSIIIMVFFYFCRCVFDCSLFQIFIIY